MAALGAGRAASRGREGKQNNRDRGGGRGGKKLTKKKVKAFREKRAMGQRKRM